MTGSADLYGYRWLASPDTRPGSWMTENGACFTFLRSVSAADVVDRQIFDNAQLLDLSDDGQAAEHFFDGGIAIFDPDPRWSVVYEAGGYPELHADRLVTELSVAEAVIVFWNVNFKTEFSYWQEGSLIVTFEFPEQRSGAHPDRLIAAMEAVNLTGSGEPDVVNTYPARMLALAERITGVHLGPDFLRRRLFTVL